MLESTIERRACQLIFKLFGIESIKLNIGGKTGYPDRAFWVPGGRLFLIEFKRPGNEPTPKQLYIHQWLRALGFQVEVHDDVEAAVNAVRKFVQRPTRKS